MQFLLRPCILNDTVFLSSSIFLHFRSGSVCMFMVLLYKLPCWKIVLRVLVDTRGHRRKRRKKVPLAAAFVMRQRLRHRVRTAAASGQPKPNAAADLTPMHTPRHYFQFMFLAILKSANFRGPPAGLSEAPLRSTGCLEYSLRFCLGICRLVESSLTVIRIIYRKPI